MSDGPTLVWDAPPGAFARSFRLGEWISDPVTPLFETWLLTTMERTMHDDYALLVGQRAPEPLHVVINGWYFYSLNFLPVSAAAMMRMLPGVLRRLPRQFRRVAPVFPPLARFGIDLYEREWRDELLPAYREHVRRAEAALEDAGIREMAGTIDDLAVVAGHYFTSVTFVAGYGWKTEIPLARFYREHLASTVGGHPQMLLRGLVSPDAPPHAVSSLDWSFPTLAELMPIGSGAVRRHDALARDREDLARRCRAALGDAKRRQFDALLAEAQRGAILREEQVRDLTLAWPYFRRALTRIGDALCARGLVRDADQIHFLTRAEIAACVAGERADLAPAASARRATWEGQRRLVGPLTLGRLPGMLVTMLGAADRALRDRTSVSAGAIVGTPASPGRASGRVRILRDASEFAQLARGDVLVCRATTPAWTPLFALACAVVTDIGSVAAHASIIAREYGIPAVVGTGDATARLLNGDVVSVDGGAGVVVRGS